MLVRKLSLIVAAAGMAIGSIASAQAAPVPSRLSAAVTNANYQTEDDDDDGGSTAVILGVILVVLIGIAAVSGGGGPESP